MPPPTLPFELVSHILDLLQASQATPPYADLHRCCLVSRTFLTPAGAALYRTLVIELVDEKLLEADSERLVHALAIYSTLGPNVRTLFLRCGNCPEVVERVALLKFFESIFGACPQLKDVEMQFPMQEEVTGLKGALSSGDVKLRRLPLSSERELDVVDLLRSQDDLRDLTIDFQHVLFDAHAPPSFRLQSLEILADNDWLLKFLLSNSTSSLKFLSFELSPFAQSTIDLSLFDSLSTLSIQGLDERGCQRPSISPAATPFAI